jgi:epoxyqueuosine reductase QueG
MEKCAFENILRNFVDSESANSGSGNVVADEIALRPELAGMRIFDEPIFAYAAADDPLFAQLKQPGIIGDHFMLPGAWLPEARTVLSVFFPFNKRVTEANRANMSWPADEWLHARIEGQQFQNSMCAFMKTRLEIAGFSCAVPMIDPRFFSNHPSVKDKTQQAYYTSNWSERHVAYICGMGTFGLSRGLITSKGIAGRFISLITSAFFEPSRRPYTKIDEYCVHCGACVRNCPVNAISAETGKAHPPCANFLDRVREQYAPRYGCGKCQVQVPCEAGIPLRAAR